MSDNRNDLPSPSAPNFNQRLRETIQTYLGRQGNPLDRGLTLRDLIETGVLKIREGFQLKPGTGGSVPLEPGDGVVDVYEPDLTPPPTPTGFAVSAAISHVFIEHDAPLYPQGHGHLRTRVYGVTVQAGAPLPVFNDAVEITQFTGTVHAHPSNPATTWRLWIKWETVDGVLSTGPAGGTNGLEVTTGQDVALLLEALTGQITESQLYQALQSRINLIDGPDTLAGSVAARIKTEETTRTSADTALSSQITTLTSTVNNNTTAIQTEATTRANADNSLFAQYTVKIDTNGFVSGFGLSSQTVNGVPVSDFQIRSDRFSITNPSVSLVTVSSLTRSTTTATLTTSTAHGLVVGDTFTLRGVTNDTNWNGAYTVLTRPSTTQITFAVASTLTTPATGTMKVGKTAIPFIVDGGVVYMAAAMIKDATITTAKIADLAVDNAKIASVAADKLTAGSIAVGQYIQSAGYTAGSSGWRINGDGNAEFSNATVRGTVYATNGEFTGTVKAGTTILGGASTAYATGSGFYAGLDSSVYKWRVGSPTGARIQWTGSAIEVYNASNQLTITSGGISASYVSGLGTLATQDTVPWNGVTNVPTTVYNQRNWDFEAASVSGWTNISSVNTSDANATNGTRGVVTTATSNAYPESIPIDPDRAYLVRVRLLSTGSRVVNVGVQCYDINKVEITATNAPTRANCAANSLTLPANQYVVYEGVITGEQLTNVAALDRDRTKFLKRSTDNARTAYASPYVVSTSGTGTLYVDFMEVNDVTDSWSQSPKLQTHNSDLGMALGPGYAVKVSNTGAYDAGVKSAAALVGGFALAFQPQYADKQFVIGVNADPDTDASNGSIDYAFHCTAAGGLNCIESGIQYNLGTYSAGDTLAIQYDGINLRYLKNSAVLRTVTPPSAYSTTPVYLDSSFYTFRAAVYGLQFLPNGVGGLGTLATQNSVNWNSQITNIPAFGNFAYLNSITSANISTYIASAAIGTAYIADAAITQAKIGTAAVGSAQIADAAITTAKIGDAQIITAKIGDAQINTAKLAGNSVTVSSSASGTAPSVNLVIPANQTMNIVVMAFAATKAISFGGSNYNTPYITTVVDGVSQANQQTEAQYSTETSGGINAAALTTIRRTSISAGASDKTVAISASQTQSASVTLVAFGMLR